MKNLCPQTKMAWLGSAFVLFLIIAYNAIGINDLGYRTVVQWPTGKTFVKFNKGIYIQMFGTATRWPDVIVFDHDRDASKGGALLDQVGVGVRYQDGGMGAVFGKERFNLPPSTDEETMLLIHKEFHNPNGLANNLIKPVTEEAMNLTAGLMRSEEAYATKRGIFTSMAKEQIVLGPYKTKVIFDQTTDETTGKIIKTEIPIIVYENGIAVHKTSDLKHYHIALASMQLNDPGFEKETKDQIADKRKATMAIITAKANAEKAKQDAITAEEKGKADVMTAKYAEEVEKAKQIVIAQRAKEVATIAARQKVEVAKQAKLEAMQFKDRAKEIKAANILEGEGLAEKKRLIIEADGALEQKLKTYERVNGYYAEAVGKNKWVSEVSMGGGESGGGDTATQLINLLTTKTAKDLALDMSMATTKK